MTLLTFKGKTLKISIRRYKAGRMGMTEGAYKKSPLEWASFATFLAHQEKYEKTIELGA